MNVIVTAKFADGTSHRREISTLELVMLDTPTNAIELVKQELAEKAVDVVGWEVEEDLF